MKRVLLLGIAVFALSAASASAEPRNSVSSQFPIYDNGGLPDLTVDPKRFVSQMEIVDRFFPEGDCSLEEGTVGGTGYRRLLRFDTVVINAGNGDLAVGDPTDPLNPYHDAFFFATCHQHYHNVGFSNYQLLTMDGRVAAPGHKQAFCLEDSLKYSNDVKSAGYDCKLQGITSGYADWYYKQLDGQWIDITGVPEGDYIVRTEMNAIRLFNEGLNRYPDFVQTTVHVPDPRNKVTIDTSPLIYDH